MIVENLNADRSWERTRESTEPETRHVDRPAGADHADRTEIDEGSRGVLFRRRDRRRRRRRRAPKVVGNAAFEVDIGPHDPTPTPPRGPRAPLPDSEGRLVDIQR